VTAVAAADTFDLSGSSATPMSRLARVEVRKALDTRAGFWFSLAIIALVVVVEVIYSFAAKDDQKNFNDYLPVVGGTLGYFMPILIVMLVTGEASQRNGLVTFTLEPRRWRIVVAKFLAGAALAVGLMVVTLVLGVLGTLFGAVTGGSPSWSVDRVTIVDGFIVANALGFLVGFAVAMLLMNTAGAIVGYFVFKFIVPVAAGILGALSSGFHDLAPWIEFNTAQSNALFSGDGVPSAEQWGQLVVSGTIWLVIPLVIGIRRLLRIEFK
jgi:ABC-2 type transport system permease protein